MKPITELKLSKEWDRPASWRPNIVRDIVTNPFVWPGGYEKVAITEECACLCHNCVADNYESCYRETMGNWGNCGWKISAVDAVGCGIDYAESIDDNAALFCDHCGRIINLVEWPEQKGKENG